MASPLIGHDNMFADAICSINNLIYDISPGSFALKQ